MILPALLLLGIGFGLIMAPSMSVATLGVAPTDAGVASAMVNTMQQVGGSVGTALLNTLAAAAVTTFALANHGTVPPGQLAVESTLHGYHTVFAWAAGIFVVGALVAGLLLRRGRLVPAAQAAPALSH